jgi:hypothetical protein
METVLKCLFGILSLIGVFLVALIFWVYPPCNACKGRFGNDSRPRKLPEFYLDDLLPMEPDAEELKHVNV